MSLDLEEHMEAFSGLMRQTRLSVFLDYDGTLTPVSTRPQDSFLSRGTKGLLKRLSQSRPSAIISGRLLSDLRERVGIDGLAYAGNHGLEIQDRDFSMIFDPGKGYAEVLQGLKSSFEAFSADYPGIILEDKGLSLSLHYRMVDEGLVEPLSQRFSKTVQKYESDGKIRVLKGKKVFEIRPFNHWTKGSAVLWMLERKRFYGTIPLCIGDNETDKEMFRAIKGAGISIFVGEGTPVADYHLKQPEVMKLIQRII